MIIVIDIWLFLWQNNNLQVRYSSQVFSAEHFATSIAVLGKGHGIIANKPKTLKLWLLHVNSHFFICLQKGLTTSKFNSRINRIAPLRSFAKVVKDNCGLLFSVKNSFENFNNCCFS